MNKFAYAGQLHALAQLGLIPQESLQQVSPWAYLASAGQMGSPEVAPEGYQGMFPGGYEHSVYSGEPEAPSRSWGRTIRKAGPAIGATLGGIGSLLLRKKFGLGTPGKALLEGVGTGALLGWLPDVYASAGEALTEEPGKPTT